MSKGADVIDRIYDKICLVKTHYFEEIMCSSVLIVPLLMFYTKIQYKSHFPGLIK